MGWTENFLVYFAQEEDVCKSICHKKLCKCCGSNHTNLRCHLQMLIGTMVSGNAESLNYVGNNGNCDQSWLIMLLGNASLFSTAQKLHTSPLSPEKSICTYKWCWSNVKGLFSPISLWTRFFICLPSFPFSPCSSYLDFFFIVLWTCSPCTPWQPLPWCSVILGYRGAGACLWVCERKPATDISKACFSEKKKRWSGVLAKSWCVGERSRGSVCVMCEIIETKKDREVDVWFCGQMMLQCWQYLCVCVLISQSDSVKPTYV